jgi:hypothetical protein
MSAYSSMDMMDDTVKCWSAEIVFVGVIREAKPCREIKVAMRIRSKVDFGHKMWRKLEKIRKS